MTLPGDISHINDNESGCRLSPVRARRNHWYCFQRSPNYRTIIARRNLWLLCCQKELGTWLAEGSYSALPSSGKEKEALADQDSSHHTAF